MAIFWGQFSDDNFSKKRAAIDIIIVEETVGDPIIIGIVELELAVFDGRECQHMFIAESKIIFPS